ncbi:MAG: hypothetical protein LQ348_007171 [Seirophora lacunosa]|nr:MAG: hypothetical protein LQ348_007171 [Seirophora lacunosa]
MTAASPFDMLVTLHVPSLSVHPSVVLVMRLFSPMPLAQDLCIAKISEGPPNEVQNQRNLADHLGLHAPFRSLATRAADIPSHSQPDHQRHKRRREPSSTSSYLEPAACFREDTERQDVGEDTAAKRRKCQERHESVDVSSPSDATIALPEKPLKTYERRPRHKTREDHYELKENKKRAAAKADEKAAPRKSKKSRKRKEKSVPDLSFSELDFLNRRKEVPKEKPRPPTKQSRRKGDKAIDTEAAISRFFAPPEERKHEAGTSPSRGEGAARRQDRSSTLPINLPAKPFLGFGSCGPGHVSPVALREDNFSQIIPLRRSSSNGSTSYVTWSETDLSRHSTSRSPTRLHRLPSENDLGAAPFTHSAARDRDHNQSEPSNHADRRARSTSSRPHQNQRGSQGRTDGNTSAASHEPEHPSAERQQPSVPMVETNKRQDEEGVHAHEGNQDVSPPNAALASLLKAQNRPELLGAVIDTLLGKTIDKEASGDGRRSNVLDTSGQVQVDAARVAETIPEIPATDGVGQSNITDPPPSTGCVADVTEVPMSHQARPSDQSQPPDWTTPGRATRLSADESHTLPPSPPAHEGSGSRKDEDIRQRGAEFNSAARMAISRTGSSNAWTGYRDLYQGQMDPVAAHGEFNFNVAQSGARRGLENSTYLQERPDEATDGLLTDHHNRHHTSVEEDWRDPHSGYRSFETNEANGWAGRYSNADDQMDALDQLPLQELLFHDDGGQEQGFHVDATAPALEDVEDMATEPDGFPIDAEASQRSGIPKFLGSRALTEFGQTDHSSPKVSRRRPITREGIRTPRACNGRVDDMPLSGFWRPNKLY